MVTWQKGCRILHSGQSVFFSAIFFADSTSIIPFHNLYKACSFKCVAFSNTIIIKPHKSCLLFFKVSPLISEFAIKKISVTTWTIFPETFGGALCDLNLFCFLEVNPDPKISSIVRFVVVGSVPKSVFISVLLQVPDYSPVLMSSLLPFYITGNNLFNSCFTDGCWLSSISTVPCYQDL